MIIHDAQEPLESGDLTDQLHPSRLSQDHNIKTGLERDIFVLEEHEDDAHVSSHFATEKKENQPQDYLNFDTSHDVQHSSGYEDPISQHPARKLGTWEGVIVTCLLSILGIIVFIRMGWVVGNAGIGWTTFIIALATTISVVTTLSMSAICTNKEMLEGGAYYLISRSLGPRFGGSIGLLFVIGQAFSISLYAIGFGESFAEMLGLSNLWIIRGFAFGSCFVMYGISLIGVRWVTKFQIVLLIALLLPFLTLFIGSFIPSESNDSGIEGYSSECFLNNWGANWMPHQNFFTVFGVFFPAMTGILSGANMSGDLRDPARSVPMGTLVAIGLSTLLYIGTTWILGSTIRRSALKLDYYVFQRLSVVSPIVLIGMYVASLSSMLASLVGGPRILYSMALDRLVPMLNWFDSINRFTGEPLRASFAVLIISIGGIFIGQLNALASLSSMFILLTYAVLNYSCFASATGDARLGWNPTFTFYNRWLSLFMGACCIALMFLIEWIAAIAALTLAIAMYIYIAQVNARVPFGFSNFNPLTYIQSKFMLLYMKLSRKPNYQSTDVIDLKHMPYEEHLS
jgi:solute carrier family 12 sodium/potassium/chloride transporter 2